MSESLTELAERPIRTAAYELLKNCIFGTGLLRMPVQPVSLFVHSTSLTEDGGELLADGYCKQSSHEDRRDEGSNAYGPRTLIPDIELMPIPANAMDITIKESMRIFPQMGIFSLMATILQPKSRGSRPSCLL